MAGKADYEEDGSKAAIPRTGKEIYVFDRRQLQFFAAGKLNTFISILRKK